MLIHLLRKWRGSPEGGKRREGKQGTARKRKGRRKQRGTCYFPSAWYGVCGCIPACICMHKCRVVSFSAVFTVLIPALQTRIVNVFKLLVGVWGLFLGQQKDTDTRLSLLPASRLTEGKQEGNTSITVCQSSKRDEAWYPRLQQWNLP